MCIYSFFFFFKYLVVNKSTTNEADKSAINNKPPVRPVPKAPATQSLVRFAGPPAQDELARVAQLRAAAAAASGADDEASNVDKSTTTTTSTTTTRNSDDSTPTGDAELVPATIESEEDEDDETTALDGVPKVTLIYFGKQMTKNKPTN